MASKTSRIFPYRPLEALAEGIWQVVGKIPRGLPMRSMIIHRLDGGGLMLHSAIAMDEAGMAALEALGQPQVVVVPNKRHRMDAAFYKNRYPEARILCPRDAHPAVDRIVPVDEACEIALEPLGVKWHQPPGVVPGELVYEITAGSAVALVFCDLLFNLPNLPGMNGWILRLLGSSGSFRMTPLGRKMMLKNGPDLRAWLLRLADTPGLELICVAHGDPIRHDAASRLRSAAQRI